MSTNDETLFQTLMQAFEKGMGMHDIDGRCSAAYIEGGDMGFLAMSITRAAAKMLSTIHSGAELAHNRSSNVRHEDRQIAASAFSKMLAHEFLQDLKENHDTRERHYTTLRTQQ